MLLSWGRKTRSFLALRPELRRGPSLPLSYIRLMPNVGQRGSTLSKRLTGKLLVMPPSENQMRRKSGRSWPSGTGAS